MRKPKPSIRKLISKAVPMRSLTVSPGDLVILTSPDFINNETARRLMTHWNKISSLKGIKIMVLGDGLHVTGVLRRERKK